MTPSESLEVFGSEIGFSYYNGSDYTDSTFRYNGAVTVWGVENSAEFSNDLTAYTYLRYISDTVSGVIYNNNYITVDIAPSYSIFDTQQIHSCIALSTSSPVSTVYQSPAWDWVISGQSIHAENDVESSSGSGVYAGIELYSVKHTFVPFDWGSQSLFSGYSLRATFNGNNPSSNVYFLLIACPYISQGAEGSQGTFTTTSQANINVNVDVDMTETNSLLEDIKDALSGIWSGITGVFVPDQSFVTGWRSDMSDVLCDSFGKYTELDSTLSRVQNAFTQTSGSAVVSFPGVSPPNVGQIISSSQVSAIPPALQGLLPEIKFAFNVLATMLFVNGMKRKFDEIIHGKVVTESESQVL